MNKETSSRSNNEAEQRLLIDRYIDVIRESMIAAGGIITPGEDEPSYHVATDLVHYNPDKVDRPKVGLTLLFDNGYPMYGYYFTGERRHTVHNIDYDISDSNPKILWQELNRRFEVEILDETPYEGTLGGREFNPNGPLVHLIREKSLEK